MNKVICPVCDQEFSLTEPNEMIQHMDKDEFHREHIKKCDTILLMKKLMPKKGMPN